MGFSKGLEACCCGLVGCIPLVFVYSITTWAVWIVLILGFDSEPESTTFQKAVSLIGFILYALLNACYTTAVFTNPGSPLHNAATDGARGGYASLPTIEPSASSPHMTYASLTAKSTGQPRFCKKCQHNKPDRSHHCSTCGQCVLKMDHHCPWLGTCVGLHNYKAFILFIGYTALFCWLCCFKSATWVWNILADEEMINEPEAYVIINSIMLVVISGVIGITLTGFTCFHLTLVYAGQTTIESLEKTRYLGPVKRNMESQFRREKQQALSGVEHVMSPLDHLKTIHANALPGVTRPEEGIEDDDDDDDDKMPGSAHPGSPYPVHDFPGGKPAAILSPAQEKLRQSYAEREMRREQERYANYLDERDSELLPHAFDLGWTRNFLDVFGSDPLFWFVPVMNSPGDGWKWEVSEKWRAECDALLRQRRTRQQMQAKKAGQVANTLPSPIPVPSAPPHVSQERSWSRGRDGYNSNATMQSLGRRTRPSAGEEPDCKHNDYADHPDHAHEDHDSYETDVIESDGSPKASAVTSLSIPRPRSVSFDTRSKGE